MLAEFLILVVALASLASSCIQAFGEYRHEDFPPRRVIGTSDELPF